MSLSLLEASYLDRTRHYVEPFAGSAALFFKLAPKTGTLGDLNGHLVNALRQVRDDPSSVYNELLSLERSSKTYYLIREIFNSGPRHGMEAATHFIYLNRNCFNGLWRTNLSGRFNVPFGGFEMGEYPPRKLFEACSRLLKHTKLRHQDFRKTIAACPAHTFIYADPPYFTATERVFVEYGKKSFDQTDLCDLIDALVCAESLGSHVALTYNENMNFSNLPRHWNKFRFEVTRNVGGFRGTRKKQAEILYTSFNFDNRS